MSHTSHCTASAGRCACARRSPSRTTSMAPSADTRQRVPVLDRRRVCSRLLQSLEERLDVPSQAHVVAADRETVRQPVQGGRVEAPDAVSGPHGSGGAARASRPALDGGCSRGRLGHPAGPPVQRPADGDHGRPDLRVAFEVETGLGQARQCGGRAAGGGRARCRRGRRAARRRRPTWPAQRRRYARHRGAAGRLGRQDLGDHPGGRPDRGAGRDPAQDGPPRNPALRRASRALVTGRSRTKLLVIFAAHSTAALSSGENVRRPPRGSRVATPVSALSLLYSPSSGPV